MQQQYGGGAQQYGGMQQQYGGQMGQYGMQQQQYGYGGGYGGGGYGGGGYGGAPQMAFQVPGAQSMRLQPSLSQPSTSFLKPTETPKSFLEPMPSNHSFLEPLARPSPPQMQQQLQSQQQSQMQMQQMQQQRHQQMQLQSQQQQSFLEPVNSQGRPQEQRQQYNDRQGPPDDDDDAQEIPDAAMEGDFVQSNNYEQSTAMMAYGSRSLLDVSFSDPNRISASFKVGEIWSQQKDGHTGLDAKQKKKLWNRLKREVIHRDTPEELEVKEFEEMRRGEERARETAEYKERCEIDLAQIRLLFADKAKELGCKPGRPRPATPPPVVVVEKEPEKEPEKEQVDPNAPYVPTRHDMFLAKVHTHQQVLAQLHRPAGAPPPFVGDMEDLAETAAAAHKDALKRIARELKESKPARDRSDSRGSSRDHKKKKSKKKSDKKEKKRRRKDDSDSDSDSDDGKKKGRRRRD
ncbi:hypothetical protein M885DRAFT_507361 [Pelagophyceae sp. CCMP2097]|nr:hypothetical protein M885DRAFT_507361 [Pelagophyceae sp. CCMP2097]